MDAIILDPSYNNGDYEEEPLLGLRLGFYTIMFGSSCPLVWQGSYPTRDLADGFLESYIESNLATADANDILYQINSSRNYNPSPNLGSIQVPVMYVNSADDFINPPELGIAQREILKVPRGKFVLLPVTNQTRCHGTHTEAAVWKQYLQELLEDSLVKE